MVHVLHEIQVSRPVLAVLCLYARLVHPWPLLFSSLSLLELLTQQIDSECCIQGLFMVLGKGPQTLQEGAWQGWSEGQICGSTPLMLQPQLCGEGVFLDVSRGLRQRPGRRRTLELPLADGARGWEESWERLWPEKRESWTVSPALQLRRWRRPSTGGRGADTSLRLVSEEST